MGQGEKSRFTCDLGGQVTQVSKVRTKATQIVGPRRKVEKREDPRNLLAGSKELS